jgi:hypothetical protein
MAFFLMLCFDMHFRASHPAHNATKKFCPGAERSSFGGHATIDILDVSACQCAHAGVYLHDQEHAIEDVVLWQEDRQGLATLEADMQRLERDCARDLAVA